LSSFLVPTLRPSDIVIIDNYGSHKGKAVRRAIRAAGAKLFFLPPYSPDLNPIEQVFAKLKTLLRKTAERTVEATWRRIGALLEAFSPQECANYFAMPDMLQNKADTSASLSKAGGCGASFGALPVHVGAFLREIAHGKGK
jgi:transposase